MQGFIDEHPEWEEQIQAVSDRLSSLTNTLLRMAIEDEVWQGLANRCEDLQSRLIAIAGLLELPREGKLGLNHSSFYLDE